MRVSRTPLFLALGLLTLAIAGAALAVQRLDHGESQAQACPPGFASAAQRARETRVEQRFEQVHAGGAEAGGSEAEQEREREQAAAARESKAGKAGRASACTPRKHPESVNELAAVNAFRSVRTSAPFGRVADGAQAAAAREQAARTAEPRTLAGTGGTWERAGKGPLVADDARFNEVNGLGLGDLAGRITDFAWDPAHSRVLASVGEGGVWASDDRGAHWHSIGDALPTQAVGSVAYAPAKGSRPGTIVALTGDAVFGGGSTYSGLGVYRSTDDGATWQHSTGVPDAALGFRIKVDPSDPDVVYAATGRGLYRSADGGASFQNVALPTGDCAGDATRTSCYLANMVTDVAIQAPGGVGDAKGGAVTAAVGWRAGNKQNVGGFVEAPANGVYVSPDGTKGSFEKVATGLSTGLPDQGTIGRIELGGATGPKQDHGFLYAVIQDASAFKKGEVSGIDVPEQSPQATPSNTYLKGIYVSADFGRTWKLMSNSTALQAPTTGSALSLYACATLYCPGIQAWYNAFIEPDPTQADAAGVPTRLTFGLEEVWQNDDAGVGRRPQNGPSAFKVIGRYFGGSTCQFLNTGLPSCPTSRGEPNSYTTHPDQHSAIYLPSPEGGSTLLVGNDGGAFQQSANRGEEFTNTKWGRGSNLGFDTLLPYDAQVAKDGTVYAGLQDNGELRIEPDGKQVEIYGGDGGFSAVDPDHSDVAYEEYVLGDMRSTQDGGKTWKDITPPTDTYQFINPFAMDPKDAAHLMTAGTKVYETTAGPNTAAADWKTVFSLGKAPSGAPNTMSAIDVRSYDTGAGQGLPTGPKTADQSWTGGASTAPGAGAGLPTEFDDHPFTIGPDDGDATATIDVTWADATNDWDLEVFRKEGANLVSVGRSASGNTTSERVVLTDPKPGDYVLRVDNYAATGTYDGKVTFTQRTADRAATQSIGYVGYCGYCDVLNTRPFDNGVATNAGGTWHTARAAGLPRRYITSIQADPADPKTVYVTLGGYSRRWLPVGAVGESTRDVGVGHVFRSTDGGDTFTDISGDLPDTPAESTVVRNGQLVVATDSGVYLASGTGGGSYQLLGSGLPTAPVYSIELKPKASDTEPDTLVAATQGRGVWKYVFAEPAKTPPASSPAPASASSSSGAAPAATASAKQPAAAAAPAPAIAAVPATGASIRSRTGARPAVVTAFRLERTRGGLRAVFRVAEQATVRLTATRGARALRSATVRRAVPGQTYRVALTVPSGAQYRVALLARPTTGPAELRTLARRM